MRDFAKLRRHLRLALLCAPLAVGGCIEARAAGGQDQPPVAPGPHSHLPRCPSGDFCAPAKKLKRFAKEGAARKLSCPTKLTPGEHTDPPEGMPASSAAMFTFDEQATTARRGEKGADKSACCYHYVERCPGGRPLLDGEAAVVAGVRRGRSWSRRRAAGRRPRVDARRAQAWLADARAEHASIASFARTTLELMAVGAPATLVAAAQRAGLDEVDHARRCFERAAAYGGVDVEPGPLPALPPRPSDLDRLARDTFVEGCVGETISALCATRAAATCRVPVERALWRRLADDEARHAALAWRTLAWIVAQRGAPLVRALTALANDLGPRADAAPVAEAAPQPGRLSAAAEAAAHRDAWRELIAPMLAELAKSVLVERH